MTYYLNTPKKEFSTLMMSCSYRSKQIQLSSNISVCVDDWNKKTKRLKSSKDSLFSVEINAKLDNYRNLVDRSLMTSKIKGHTYLQAKEQIRQIFGKNSKSKSEFTLIEFFEDARENWGKPMPKNFKTFENVFIEYLKKSKQTKASYDDVGLTMLNGFKKHLEGKGLMDSTIQVRFKSLFQYMKFGLGDYHRNTNYHPDSFKFNVKQNRKVKGAKFIYLFNSEYEKLKNFDFGESYGLARSAHRLIIECETGLRYSDMNNLSQNNVIEKNGKLYLQTATMKTAGNYSEPMSETLISIYRLYGNGFPPEIENQTFNRHLKKIGELIGMNDFEHYMEFIGGNKKRVEKKRYELLTSHTGRRDYATKQYMKGELLEIISLKMGHSSTEQTKGYIHSDAYGERMKLRK